MILQFCLVVVTVHCLVRCDQSNGSERQKNRLADLMVIHVQYPANRKKESWQIAEAHCKWCFFDRTRR